jgi:anti-anti-sigma regulatory factor
VRTVCFRDDTYVLTLESDLDLAAAERLSVALRTLPGRRFIVDLTKARFVDRTGAETLARAAAGKPLTIVTDDPRAVRMLEVVDRSLSVHALLADALAY